MQSRRDPIRPEMWGTVIGRSAGLKPKTAARSWWSQGSASCRVLPGHLQYREMESRSLKSWEDGSVCKRSPSKLTYLSFNRQRSVSKQGRVVTMTYPTNLPALFWLFSSCVGVTLSSSLRFLLLGTCGLPEQTLKGMLSALISKAPSQ